MFFFTMSYEPTPQAVILARRARAAIARLGLLVKEAAALLGVPYRYLDDQLSARRPLGTKVFELDGFDVALAEVIADETGSVLIDKRSVRLIEVEARPKLMARATMPILSKRKGVA